MFAALDSILTASVEAEMFHTKKKTRVAIQAIEEVLWSAMPALYLVVVARLRYISLLFVPKESRNRTK